MSGVSPLEKLTNNVKNQFKSHKHLQRKTKHKTQTKQKHWKTNEKHRKPTQIKKSEEKYYHCFFVASHYFSLFIPGSLSREHAKMIADQTVEKLGDRVHEGRRLHAASLDRATLRKGPGFSGVTLQKHWQIIVIICFSLFFLGFSL